MNKRGFTLIELLAVIVLLAILVMVAVPVISGISSNIRGNMLDEKKEMIEESAVLYGEDTKGTVINSSFKYKSYPCVNVTISRLVEEKYLDKDKKGEECGNKCIVDPSDINNYLDNYNVIVYYRNNRINSILDLEQKITCK